MSLYFHYCAAKVKELEFAIPEVRQFMDIHKAEIRRGWDSIPKTRKYALQIYYLSPVLFRVAARIMGITGLDKKMGIQMK